MSGQSCSPPSETRSVLFSRSCDGVKSARSSCDYSLFHFLNFFMDSPRPRTRRRESRDQPAADSSSDELAAGPEVDQSELRRSSWTKQKSFTPQRSKHQERQYIESESSDELAVDADEYWHGSRGRRSPSPIDRHADSSSNDRSHGGSDEDRMSNDDETLAPVRDDMSDRSSTPVPSVEAPSKPERLNYKEKFVLRGHLRGVSAVQFSPDCSMIASGGMYLAL